MAILASELNPLLYSQRTEYSAIVLPLNPGHVDTEPSLLFELAESDVVNEGEESDIVKSL
jgi:hypothetical protein